MPNRGAKDRKAKRQALNKRWAKEGRTANQHKKWLERNSGKPVNRFGKR